VSYVYIRSEPRVYTVGFYDPEGGWMSESDHDSTDKAAARVAYLNGQVVQRQDAASMQITPALAEYIDQRIAAATGARP
jgi:hypothetical protein